ncbi:MAG: hypothetical protein AAFZ15_18305 [Bacteroidota bacterium]
MVSKTKIEDIKQLISESDFENAFKELASIEDNPEENNVAVQQQAYKHLKNLEKQGTIAQGEAILQRNKIAVALMDIMDGIESAGTDEKKQGGGLPFSKKRFYILGAVVLLMVGYLCAFHFPGFYWEEVRGEVVAEPNVIPYDEMEVSLSKWKSGVDENGKFQIKVPFHLDGTNEENGIKYFELILEYRANGQLTKKVKKIPQKKGNYIFNLTQ